VRSGSPAASSIDEPGFGNNGYHDRGDPLLEQRYQETAAVDVVTDASAPRMEWGR
jgi:hypothetical protein